MHMGCSGTDVLDKMDCAYKFIKISSLSIQQIGDHLDLEKTIQKYLR